MHHSVVVLWQAHLCFIGSDLNQGSDRTNAEAAAVRLQIFGVGSEPCIRSVCDSHTCVAYMCRLLIKFRCLINK